MDEKELNDSLSEPREKFDLAVARMIDACRLGPGSTPEQEAERLEAEKIIADFERQFPELAAKENARIEREEKEIRERVFRTQNEES